MPRQGIGQLPAGAFGKLRTAKLVLNFNRLGDRVQAGALDGQGTSLAELQLAGCGITSLPARLLAGMDALTRLHLWGNRLSEFPVRFFRAAANLRELMLKTTSGCWSLFIPDVEWSRHLITSSPEVAEVSASPALLYTSTTSGCFSCLFHTCRSCLFRK